MIIDNAIVSRSAFEAGTGWELKPEGACRGELCIPLADPPANDATQVDAVSLATQMGLPVVHDTEQELWAIGPDSHGARALATAIAPNLTLPTVDGETFELDSLRGSKVVLVAWSPY